MEDESVEDLPSRRFRKLGFKPQKENPYNKLLPYADVIDDESLLMLAELKANLGRAVILREMRPGCVTWCTKLSKYIKLNGLKFSKEDHIAFIHLLYELVTIPSLEPYLVNRFANLLVLLLKKKELVSPEELVLPWRPLYKITLSIEARQSSLGMYRHFLTLENSLDNLILAARFYFPAEATEEMLAEWRPMLCPLNSNTMCFAMQCLWQFLPISLPPDLAHQGYMLWLDELMALWEACHNAAKWEPEMMLLVSFLASFNIGRIDWEPHVPLMFTRFLHNLNLPVYYKQHRLAKSHHMDMSSIALWIVATLGGKSSTQMYLDRLMKSLESYFHPANWGRWVARLKELLCKLPQHFIKRVHRERFKKPSWMTPVPDNYRLTEEDITRFVESMKGAALMAVYTRGLNTDMLQAMQQLATLRPNIIIPPIIDKMYSTMDSVTEPHKYTSTMQCMVAIARPMVQSTAQYPEGPTHVIPLLLATLPGIDPNDIRKCFVTFQFLSTFATLVPLIDSSTASQYYDDLTPEEEIVCASSSQLEDFVLQFLERCLNLAESSALETTRQEAATDQRCQLEKLSESVIASTVSALLNQAQPSIFTAALRKLHSFVTGRILETTVAGRFIATICRTFTLVKPEETLRMLLPPLCETVLMLTESDDVLREEILDNELMFNLVILAEVVDPRSGGTLQQHLPLLTQVLDRTLHLASREGYQAACLLLRHTLASLMAVSPVEYRSTMQDYSTPTQHYLPVRDWGIPGKLHQLGLKWRQPGEQEAACVQEIISKYLPPEIETINKYISNEKAVSREELQCSLCIVAVLLEGSNFLPVWDEQPLTVVDSLVEVRSKIVIALGVKCEVTMPDGSNVRKTMIDLIASLQDKLFVSAEDDTKSFFQLITIWSHLLNVSHSVEECDRHRKNSNMVKKMLQNRLVGGKAHVRALLIDKATLQHETRQCWVTEALTPSHAAVIRRMLTLATSHYSEVRIMAQGKLFSMIDRFPYAYTLLVSQLISNLQADSNTSHELFKGTLYMLLGPKGYPILTRHNWQMISKLWPSIVKSKLSEKPSVIKLMNSLVEAVHKHFPTITLQLEVPSSCITAGEGLWKNTSEPVPSVALPSEQEVEQGLSVMKLRNEQNLASYLCLLNSTVDCIQLNNLHWRHHWLALSFMRDVVHPDQQYPPRIISNFLHTLINDSLLLRKVAIRCTVFVLKQLKPIHVKEVVDPGADNAWLQYDKNKRPLSQEDWDQPRYCHKPHIGYYVWPKELKLYSCSSKQPAFDRPADDLSLGEKEVDQFFSQPANIERLINFLSLEEKKGQDKFNAFKLYLFKGLFRNTGDKHFELFKPHLERLVSEKQESSQRCAAEIIAGVIRGSKHWPFDKVSKMWEFLLPLISKALTNMTVETVNDWGVCMASALEKRDPNRHHWLLELLLEDPLRNEASFLQSGRLYALQGSLNQQQWKLNEPYHRTLNYLKPYLTHSFQNVRVRIGSVLATIFNVDINSKKIHNLNTPHASEFVAAILPRLKILETICTLETMSTTPNGNNSIHKLSGSDTPKTLVEEKSGVVTLNGKQLKHDADKEIAIRLFETVCNWVLSSLSHSHCSGRPEFFCFLPIACHFESYEGDIELKKNCVMFIAALAQSLTLPQYMPYAFLAITKVSESASWSARASCLEFFQAFVFHNMATIINEDAWVQEVRSLVLRLIEDESVEVREKAGQVLGGLIHCDFMSDTNKLMDRFKQLSSSPLRSKAKGSNSVDIAQAVRLRHAGVLGLCAFINASPYDVPELMPHIFLLLGPHLNDPQPIPSTIRNSLGDFKRTHHDNWEQHKLKFTEDQLSVLTDLIIPPSYCA